MADKLHPASKRNSVVGCRVRPQGCFYFGKTNAAYSISIIVCDRHFDLCTRKMFRGLQHRSFAIGHTDRHECIWRRSLSAHYPLVQHE